MDLEGKFQSEFQDARVTSTIHLAIAAITQSGIHILEVGMIQGIERLCPELQIETIMQRERLVERQVQGCVGGATNRSVLCISIEPIRRSDEGARVEPFAQMS